MRYKAHPCRGLDQPAYDFTPTSIAYMALQARGTAPSALARKLQSIEESCRGNTFRHIYACANERCP